MAAKTANVLARVEPEVKAQAEEIMAQLGVPVSVVINMLYKQIIMTRGIPFQVTVPKVKVPKARDEMTDEEFYERIRHSLQQVKEGKVIPIEEAFGTIMKELEHDGDI